MANGILAAEQRRPEQPGSSRCGSGRPVSPTAVDLDAQALLLWEEDAQLPIELLPAPHRRFEATP
jgi:hypothetical protein